jgi:hypothetical protein
MSIFWGPDFDELQAVDPEVAAGLLTELERQRTKLQLIASENFASPAVLAAQGSVLTNKYAEGYPGRRYYGGCGEAIDPIEQLAIDRAKALFGADHANVQPHSGASANLAVFLAVLEPGDPILAMSLPHGGHLSHGMKLNLSGRWFDVASYGVREDTHLIDMDEVRRRRSSTDRSSSSPAGPRTSTTSTSPRSGPSPTRSVRCCCATRRTSSDSSPAMRTRTRSRTATSSPSRRTRRCAVRAVR